MDRDSSGGKAQPSFQKLLSKNAAAYLCLLLAHVLLFPHPIPTPTPQTAMPALLHFSGVIFPAPLGLRGRRCPSRSGEGISWADEPEIDPYVSPFSG